MSSSNISITDTQCNVEFDDVNSVLNTKQILGFTFTAQNSNWRSPISECYYLYHNKEIIINSIKA